ncbi:hypothetical protein HaLaN_01160 [Haematococcus lacustris]|uniref:Uncharacterized protein n=1 Tax=Haematococcus lacustris TaxID=44745 RepID=A0A699YAY1_HAELA|nr:hypothetical protein HaLaN_01160 [Haematococcus lacustris]
MTQPRQGETRQSRDTIQPGDQLMLVSLVVAVVLLQAADRHLALLGLRDPGVPFTVLHLRLGGSLGEAKASFHKDPVAVEEVVEAVACAKAFAKAFSRHPTPGMTSLEKMNTSKLVLITDNIELRRLVADKRFMPGLVSVGAGCMAAHGIMKQPLFATGPLMAGQAEQTGRVPHRGHGGLAGHGPRHLPDPQPEWLLQDSCHLVRHAMQPRAEGLPTVSAAAVPTLTAAAGMLRPPHHQAPAHKPVEAGHC